MGQIGNLKQRVDLIDRQQARGHALETSALLQADRLQFKEQCGAIAVSRYSVNRNVLAVRTDAVRRVSDAQASNRGKKRLGHCGPVRERRKAGIKTRSLRLGLPENGGGS